jgi:APA family basic amino acid/polyamine antiporter
LNLNNSNIGSAIVATGAICGMTTVLMMQIYGLSRIFYVIARDGLIPHGFAKIHPKYDSPHITILFFVIAIGLLAAFAPVNILGQLTSMGALIDYMAVAIAVMLFRIKKPDVLRPFKCPAIFAIAPIAFLACGYLFVKQMISPNGELMLSGQIIIIWFVVIAALYFVKKSFFGTSSEDNTSK